MDRDIGNVGRTGIDVLIVFWQYIYGLAGPFQESDSYRSHLFSSLKSCKPGKQLMLRRPPWAKFLKLTSLLPAILPCAGCPADPLAGFCCPLQSARSSPVLYSWSELAGHRGSSQPGWCIRSWKRQKRVLHEILLTPSETLSCGNCRNLMNTHTQHKNRKMDEQNVKN